MQGLGSRLSGGNDTSAWLEKWSRLDKPLLEYVTENHHLVDNTEMVSSFVTREEIWNTQKWRLFLPNEVVDAITEVPPPRGEAADQLWWRDSSDGRFSIKSAYNLMADKESQPTDRMWKTLWKLDIPEKVKMFLWQVCHERLPINELRKRRGLSETDSCPRECTKSETELHTLRDCEVASNVWQFITNPIYHSAFFVATCRNGFVGT